MAGSRCLKNEAESFRAVAGISGILVMPRIRASLGYGNPWSLNWRPRRGGFTAVDQRQRAAIAPFRSHHIACWMLLRSINQHK